jgi:2-polyprenyl-3-methyl-5-hydroxy-6-metoxy-1,4-benzoquinol methylase
MRISNWAHFWKHETHSSKAVTKISTASFASTLEKRFQIKTTDKILDYGCGPGFLIDYFTKKGNSIVGADISEFYIKQCGENHPESLFLLIASEPEQNKKILQDQLRHEQFDFIILLSISQYLKSVIELETIIKILLPYKKKKGKIVIADVIDPHTSSIRDAGSLFFNCVKKNEIVTFLRFVSYFLFSNYRKVSNNLELLKINEQAIQEISVNNALTYEKIVGLTIHASRTNYVLSDKTNI